MSENNSPALPSHPPVVAGKHSRLGIASFALALVAIILMCVSYFAINALVDQNAQQSGLSSSTLHLLLRASSFAGYFGLIFNLIGVGLGIGSMFQKNSRKLFGILGLVINILALCPWAGMAFL